MDDDQDTTGERAADRELAAEFEALHPHLTRVAYGILGSLAEAEDVVQEAWLRLGHTERAAIEDLRAWLTRVVGRVARVNGAAGLVVHDRYSTSVVSLTIDGRRITAVDIVRNPDKLRGLTEEAGR